MGKYTFSYKSDLSSGVDVAVEFDDEDSPFVGDVMLAFEQFLLGCTFQPETIRKYLDVEKAKRRQLKLILLTLKAPLTQTETPSA